jgi:hypothetical protein
MSTLENLQLEDLGLNFADLSQIVDADAPLGFGPSKQQLRSMNGWEGYDGKLFKPYSINERVSKMSDFISAAIQAVRDQERELDKNEYHRKKDAEQAEKKAQENKVFKGTKV